MLRALALTILVALPMCADETISGYTPTDTTWQLESLNGDPVTFDATLRLPEEGRIDGDGPCNSFSAEQTAPYPWISIGAIAATRALCPEIDGERAYLAALRAMSIAEVSGDVLILSNDRGDEMVFRARQD